MITKTQSTTLAGSKLMAIATAAFLGLGVMLIAGHVQATTLHDAAHDVRHVAGFPCH